ncbi:hypothetical protein AS159_04645 [Thermotoga sp. Ku-13t]|uniref:hypothetical protein n=1 Tax=Thermotoga sp. Ku-13t TaxID=1755813 RepID=UPI0013EC19D4|nr:hypothetical protein [Thermotoga sp. Ku-13t]KAF2958953.1 hypothetical protein AS159_04645 [Thermotoga sp. Ku-13t]
MRAYVELSDKDSEEKIRSAILMSGGVAVARQIDADIFVGETVHPFLDTVLVSSEVPADLAGVIDVVLPSQTLEYYRMKFKMISCYVSYKLGLEDFLNEEIYKSQRYGFPLSVLMARLSNFDVQFLQRIYSIFKRQARESDRFFIFNESIVAVLPYTNLGGAKVFARRLLRRSRSLSFGGRTPELVLSVSQASSEDDAFDLLGKLEEAIKKAIQSGQRIVVA